MRPRGWRTTLAAIAMRAAIAVPAALLSGGACKSSPHDSPAQATGSSSAPGASPTGAPHAGAGSSGPADAALPDANLDACRAAAATVTALPAHQRAQALLDACKPCGDWDPLLRWSTPVADGGPSRAAITDAMVACKAYCDPNAKQRFLNNLDDARGQDTRKPWRLLGEICGAAVSAVPDARFMTAPYFALDRIARALAPAAPIQIPLPAVSVTGIGIDAPSVTPAVPPPGAAAITVDAVQLVLGALPVAALSATGLAVTGDYPGNRVDPAALPAALAKLGEQPVLLLAPSALRAARIAEVLAAADGIRFRLAAALPGPGGWSVPGAIPIDLTRRGGRAGLVLTLAADATPTLAAARAAPAADLVRGAVEIAVDDTARVDALAQLLAALAERGATTAVVVGPPAAHPKNSKPATRAKP